MSKTRNITDFGNELFESFKRLRRFSFLYDSLDRIIRIEESGGETKEYTYDVAGNVTSMTDALENVTRYEYSPAGELTKVTEALGNETVYRYDLCERLAEIRQYEEDGSLKEGAKWLDEHKEDIGKVAITVAGVAAVTALTVSTLGVGQASSPEAYAGAMFGGAIGAQCGNAFLGGFTATSVGELLEKVTGISKKGLGEIFLDGVVTGIISGGMNFVAQKAVPYDLAFLCRLSLTEGQKDFIETIWAAIGIGGYYIIKEECTQ